MMYSNSNKVTNKRLFALIVLLAMAFGPYSSAFATTVAEDSDLCTNIADMQITVPPGFSVTAGICTEIPVDPSDLCTNIEGTQLIVPQGMASQGGVCVNVLELNEDDDTEVTPQGACEFEGHKYDEKGSPLSNWAIGLMKVLTFGDRSDNVYGLDEKTTDKDGYYCLEWDGYTGTEVVEEPHSFMYRVYEVLQSGWTNVSVEKGTKEANEANTLTVVDDNKILTENGYTSVQVGEINGYVYADDAYHVDFYNKQTVVVDPCEEESSTTTDQLARTLEDDCDDDDSDGEDVLICAIAVLEDVENEANTETLAWVSLNATSATLTQFGAIASTSVATGTAVVTTTGLEETFTLTVFDESEASSTCSVIVNAPTDSSNGGGGNGGNGGGGNGGGKKISLNDNSNDSSESRDGDVAGDSTSKTPKGAVLGAATDKMPLGAPATGGGATAPIGVTLPNIVAILGGVTTARRIKNGN